MEPLHCIKDGDDDGDDDDDDDGSDDDDGDDNDDGDDYAVDFFYSEIRFKRFLQNYSCFKVWFSQGR